MKRLSALALLPACLLLLASSNGEWLRRVSPKLHTATNPLLTNPESGDRAARAGAQLYRNECAKCHAADGGGLHGRPPVISDRISSATDGDLFWLMTNGSPWHGMPPWNMLPAAQRWQLVAYLRALNDAELRPAPVPQTSSHPTLSPATSSGAAR